VRPSTKYRDLEISPVTPLILEIGGAFSCAEHHSKGGTIAEPSLVFQRDFGADFGVPARPRNAIATRAATAPYKNPISLEDRSQT
jgi:hypothetical protein